MSFKSHDFMKSSIQREKLGKFEMILQKKNLKVKQNDEKYYSQKKEKKRRKFDISTF